MNGSDTYTEVTQDVAPYLGEIAREEGMDEFADRLEVEMGDYTISDYLKPSRDDLNPGIVSGGLAGAGIAHQIGEASHYGLMAAAILATSYTVEKARDRELGRKAAENSWDHWRKKLSGDEEQS